MPSYEGRQIDGIPRDQRGFIPVDEHGRVRGLPDVFAAGDATDFPVEQGGLAAQQSDTVAATIGLLSEFAPGERHEVLAISKARLFLLLAPWPGENHPGSMTIQDKLYARRRAAKHSESKLGNQTGSGE